MTSQGELRAVTYPLLTTTVGNKIEVDLRYAGTGDVVIFDINGKNNIECH